MINFFIKKYKQRFLQEELLLFLAISVFVCLITAYAQTMYILPMIKVLYKQVWHVLTGKNHAKLVLEYFGDQDGINSAVAAVCFIFHSFIISYLWIFIAKWY